MATTQRKTPQTLLVDWANGQDKWVRSIVGEALSTRQPLGEMALASAYDCLLLEKELKPGKVPQIPPLKASGTNGESVQKLELVRLGNVDGVNALRSGEELLFSPRLTVLFGENASGKSGYVRVLKRVAAVRSQEEVLPNLVSGMGVKPQCAAIKYRLDGKEDELKWKGESGVTPFTRMNAFDTRAVAVHLDEDLSYSYTPRDLALFRITHDSIEAVKQHLDEERKKALPLGNPYTTLFARGTRIYSKIETLGPQTDIGELERLALVGESEAAQIPEFRSKVEALKSEAGQLRLEVAKGDLELFRRVQTVSSTLEGVDWSRCRALMEAADVAKKKHEDATVNAFAGTLIPAILSKEWRQFIEAGESYIQSATPGEYPTEGEPCVYCRQPLQLAAVSLVRKYRDFTNNQLKRGVTEAQVALDAFTRPVKEMALASVLADVKRRADAIAVDAVPAVLRHAQALFEQAKPVQDKCVRGEAVSNEDAEPVSGVARNVKGLASGAMLQAEDLIKVLTSEASEREKILLEESSRLAELEARVKLSELIAVAKEYVANSKWAAGAERVGAGFGGVLRSLTVVAKSASEELVNQDFERLFEEECKSLRAPKVRLEFPGREGQPKRRKSLAPKHTLSEILSEGEQKVIALADFLAEAGMPQTIAPVIFDDPVNSLDYKRLQYVVDRIVQLSAQRQVVVFTHNIWFTAEMLNRFEKNPGDCKYYEVSTEDNVPGKVEALQHPKWDTPAKIGSQIEARIKLAEKQSGVVREDLIRGSYSQIRSWCEAFIEKEVLADVTARYRPHVRMTSLPNIKVKLLDDTIGRVLPIFEKACRITEAHSQPLETLCVKPALDELKEDWKTLQDERKKFV